jgi:hypothetical protein
LLPNHRKSDLWGWPFPWFSRILRVNILKMSSLKQMLNTEQCQRRRVTRPIKLALARIAEKDPELSGVIKESIKTGTYLSYMPVK